MEIQLQELIEQIKRDGVAAAEAEAKKIVDSAKAEAEKIISDANAQASKIMANAKAENEKVTKSSEDAIRQAGRNLLISFRESVARELNAIVGEGVDSVYSSGSLEELIVSAIEKWSEKPDAEELTVILNSEDISKLEDSLLSTLKKKISAGVTLKANDSFLGGFRIAMSNSNVYYDYSKEAVVDMLANYLSPKVVKLLKEAE